GGGGGARVLRHQAAADDDDRRRGPHQGTRRPALHHRDRLRPGTDAGGALREEPGWDAASTAPCTRRARPGRSFMLPGLELAACADLSVPVEVMRHVVRVESGFNPYAIGVVGGRLVRQPRNRDEAVATARMLEKRGFNFSLGIAQVNRHNLRPYGLDSYERAFDVCANLQAGSKILAECHDRAKGDWGKALSRYYSGDFRTGFQHGYVQKVLATWNGAGQDPPGSDPVPLAGSGPSPTGQRRGQAERASLLERRIQGPAVAVDPEPGGV